MCLECPVARTTILVRERANVFPPPATCPAEIRDALTGPVPSVHTPFDREGGIDFDALRRQLDFVIAAGAKTVVLTWGDSLYSLLTDDEIAQVTKAAVEHVNGRAMVVAADNIWWTGKEVEFAKYCVEVGADVLMVLPPDWAGSVTVESLVQHYAAVARPDPPASSVLDPSKHFHKRASSHTSCHTRLMVK